MAANFDRSIFLSARENLGSSRFPPRLRKDFFPLRTKNRVEFPHACPWHFRPCSAAYHERSYVTNSGIEDNRIYDGIIQARLLFAEATCTHDARAHPARTGRSKMLDPPMDNLFSSTNKQSLNYRAPTNLVRELAPPTNCLLFPKIITGCRTLWRGRACTNRMNEEDHPPRVNGVVQRTLASSVRTS